MIPDSNTADAVGVAQLLITSNMPAIIFICAILFFAMITAILIRTLNKDYNETIEVDNDELFSDEI